MDARPQRRLVDVQGQSHLLRCQPDHVLQHKCRSVGLRERAHRLRESVDGIDVVERELVGWVHIGPRGPTLPRAAPPTGPPMVPCGVSRDARQPGVTAVGRHVGAKGPTPSILCHVLSVVGVPKQRGRKAAHALGSDDKVVAWRVLEVHLYPQVPAEESVVAHIPCRARGWSGASISLAEFPFSLFIANGLSDALMNMISMSEEQATLLRGHGLRVEKHG